MLMNQLEEFRKTHRLSIPECAKLIGVSVQTLYNVKEGKPIKHGTLTKIQMVISNDQQSVQAAKLGRLLDEYNLAYRTYHECLLKEWQASFSQLNSEEHAQLAKLIEKMQEIQSQIQDYHAVVKGIIGRVRSTE